MKKMSGVIVIILTVILLLITLSGCQKVPGEDIDVSRLIDFKINNFKAAKFEFYDISDFLEKDAFKGNMLQIDYGRVFKDEIMNSTDFVEIVAAKGENNRASYKLWRVFASENNAAIKAAFNTIPFLKGEYSSEDEASFIVSWYDGKWFFFVKTSSEELRETVKKNLDTFFENDTVVNESVIGI